jgi:hypothetical protein
VPSDEYISAHGYWDFVRLILSLLVHLPPDVISIISLLGFPEREGGDLLTLCLPNTLWKWPL